MGCFLLQINQGSRFEKEFILKTLMNACKVPFVPIYVSARIS